MSVQVEDVSSQINAPHKFERKKISKNVKCFVCNSYIWSGACACILCDVPAHKSCAVKARKENCPVMERELSEALSSPGSDKVVKKSSKPNVNDQMDPPSSPTNSGLEIFLSDGTSKTITYNPDTILSSIIQQIREEKVLDGAFVVYDKAGKVVTNVDQSLKKIKTAFPLFYTSVGEISSKSGKKAKKKKILQSPEKTSGKLKSKSILAINTQKKKKGLKEQIPELVEQRHGTMSITVVSVSDLANQSSAYKLLYFTLTNLDTNQRHRSKLLENTATPTWNQTIKFPMPVAFGQWIIKIWAIRKIDANAADVLLGEADFVLKNFNDGDGEVKTLPLRKEENKKEKKAGKRIDSLQQENLQLRHELENEKKNFVNH